VVIATYSILSGEGGATTSTSSQLKALELEQRAWGLLVLDEVHVLPATTYAAAAARFKHHEEGRTTLLGLTATLVREDGNVAAIEALVGPVRFQMPRSVLLSERHIAEVHVCYHSCPVTAQFQRAMEAATGAAERRLLAALNPAKVALCRSLVERALKGGKKVLVYVDELMPLRQYAELLGAPSLCGSRTHGRAGADTLQAFREAEGGAVLVVSKWADYGLDVPEAKVAIEVSLVSGSRLQEMQRLGRVQRVGSGGVAEFHCLVCEGSHEVEYARRREAWVKRECDHVVWAEAAAQLPQADDVAARVVDDLVKDARAEMLRRRARGNCTNAAGEAESDDSDCGASM